MARMDDLATKVTAALNPVTESTVATPKPSTPTTTVKKPKCPYTEPTKEIKVGAKGNNVKWLQWHLNQTGAKLKIDGDFGQATKNAVIAFQKKYKLTDDGIVGPKTRAKLKQVI